MLGVARILYEKCTGVVRLKAIFNKAMTKNLIFLIFK